MPSTDLSSARSSLTVSVASARRASGLSSPERRYCSIFWRAPSIVYFLGVQQVLHEHDQLDLATLVHAITRAVLGGIQEAELTLPVAQHVRLQVGKLADLPDREELLNRLSRRAAAHQRSAFSSRSIRFAHGLTRRLVLEQHIGDFARDRQLDAVTLAQRDRSACSVHAFDDGLRPGERCGDRLPLPSATPSRDCVTAPPWR